MVICNWEVYHRHQDQVLIFINPSVNVESKDGEFTVYLQRFLKLIIMRSTTSTGAS